MYAAVDTSRHLLWILQQELSRLTRGLKCILVLVFMRVRIGPSQFAVGAEPQGRISRYIECLPAKLDRMFGILNGCNIVHVMPAKSGLEDCAPRRKIKGLYVQPGGFPCDLGKQRDIIGNLVECQ